MERVVGQSNEHVDVRIILPFRTKATLFNYIIPWSAQFAMTTETLASKGIANRGLHWLQSKSAIILVTLKLISNSLKNSIKTLCICYGTTLKVGKYLVSKLTLSRCVLSNFWPIQFSSRQGRTKSPLF